MHKNLEKDHDNIELLLKQISSKDFLNLGVEDVAYVKAVRIEGKRVYAIHGADGTPLSVERTRDLAVMAVKNNEMHAVTVH